MRVNSIRALRDHIHCLVIVPLVIVALTWPTFPSLFDGDRLWLHVDQRDKYLRIWDAWHIERVLAGEAELYHTDYMFHPAGVSLAFQSYSIPHALLLIVLQKIMPVDNAYNLLFLLIHAFNAFCAYTLFQHLIKDKWIALFGAIVVVASLPFPYDSTVPDLITIGTLPLTIYFLRRAVTENRPLFAALAGFCAGITAFISLYIFAIILLTVAMCAAFCAFSRSRQAAFWRLLLLSIAVCASIGYLRLYPMFADAAVLKEGLESHKSHIRSNDLLDHFVLTDNPFTGDLLRAAFNVPPRASHEDAYLGYVNLFFAGCALLHFRRRLLPWLAILVVFAALRLGHFLTVNSVEFPDIVLPERVLSDWFPTLFGQIAIQEYYQFGLVIPLALLSSFGLAALLQTKTGTHRLALVLAAALIVSVESFRPLEDETLEREKLEYISWLKNETDDQIKLINLARADGNPHYFLYLQTLTGYPTAYGYINRRSDGALSYVNANLLLYSWEHSRNIHCFSYNQQSYMAALEQLLADGFTHIVEHDWLWGDQFIQFSLLNVPPAYDDGFVKIYRLKDMRRSCENIQVKIPHIDHFLRSPWLFPGKRAAILSFHSKDRIRDNIFDYLVSLFSDWDSFLHLYFDDGKLRLQTADDPFTDLNQFTRDNQVVYLVYDANDAAPTMLKSRLSLDQFQLCQRYRHEDGAVIERYISRDFACKLFEAQGALQVDYENGARLENLLYQFGRDQLDVQFLWRNLPPDPHSVSLQVFNASGEMVRSQDSTIGLVSLARQRIDVSALPPGEYTVKLIVYNFQTGRSVPGRVSRDGSRFDREMEIARAIRG
ncbi:MAG: hypothetical protein OXG85_00705 [Chloroflexi bacterium]|nr:hypothetical protein [Chloroflexota bacterium]